MPSASRSPTNRRNRPPEGGQPRAACSCDAVSRLRACQADDPDARRRPARRPPRAGLRGLRARRSMSRPAARSAGRAGTPSFPSRRRSATRAAIRCRPGASISVEDGRCPRCRAAAARVSLAPRDRPLRRDAARDRARAEVRRAAIAGAAARRRWSSVAGATCWTARTSSSRCRCTARAARARGFNQAAEIARHLGFRCRTRCGGTRPTPSQTDLPAARRHANVRGAFAVHAARGRARRGGRAR